MKNVRILKYKGNLNIKIKSERRKIERIDDIEAIFVKNNKIMKKIKEIKNCSGDKAR
jgi:hypothetical protein